MSGASLGLLTILLLSADPEPTPTVDPTLTVDLPELETTQLRPPQAAPLAFEFGATVEARSGHPLGTNVAHATTDLEVDPKFALRYLLPTGGVTLAYEPRVYVILSQPDQNSEKVYYFHRARLNVDFQTSPTWRFYVNARFAYGQYDFNPLSTVVPQVPGTGLPPSQPGGTGSTSTPTTSPNLGSIPNVRFIKAMDTQGSAGFSHSFNPRLEWIFSAGYDASGGVTAEDQLALPLQQGPIATTGLVWNARYGDEIRPLLSAYQTRFSNDPANPARTTGPRSTIVDATVSWTHGFGNTVQTELTLGAGTYHGSGIEIPPGVPVPAQTSVLPIGGFSLRASTNWHNSSWRNELQLLAAPAPDSLTGIVNERLSGLLSSIYGVGEHLRFGFLANGSGTWNSLQRDARLEGRVTYAVSRELELSIGGRAAWLRGSTLLGNSASTWGFGWVGFVDITGYIGNAAL